MRATIDTRNTLRAKRLASTRLNGKNNRNLQNASLAQRYHLCIVNASEKEYNSYRTKYRTTNLRSPLEVELFI